MKKRITMALILSLILIGACTAIIFNKKASINTDRDINLRENKSNITQPKDSIK